MLLPFGELRCLLKRGIIKTGTHTLETVMERKVGFWNNNKNQFPEYPLPYERDKPWKGRRDFLESLITLEDLIRKHKVGRINRFRGFSSCRCCNEVNGSHEFHYDGWTWPEGLRHYVEKHNVKPDQVFIDFLNSTYTSERVYAELAEEDAPSREIKKPKVDDLFNAHTRYQSRIMQAAHYTTSVADYKRLFKEAQLAFKEDLEELGLADQLDWSDMNLE